MVRTALRIGAALSLSLSLGVACTSSPTISFDERADFSRYRTWDWLPGGARTIDAPTPYIVGLDRDLAHLVERALEKRGFLRARRRPDLQVGVVLNVRREEVIVHETGAIEQLSSLHHSPSFQVQSTVKRRETYERSRLVIFASDARAGRIVWKGALEERFRNQFAPHLARTIAELLERFPPAGRAPDGWPPPAREPTPGGPSEFTGPPSRSEADV